MPEHNGVQPPLHFIPPRFQPLLFRTIRTIYPLYVRLGLRISRIDVRGFELLERAFDSFQQYQSRLIIAFRHPHVDDAPLTAHLIGHYLWKRGRLRRYPFARFVYDRGVPLWAGRFTGWLLPRMGGISVFRGKLDSASLAEIRATMLNGDQPIAIAPEGGVSYREWAVPPLEAGVAQFAFWCAADLDAARRRENVELLPVTVHYRHPPASQRALVRLVLTLERLCGLDKPERRPRDAPAAGATARGAGSGEGAAAGERDSTGEGAAASERDRAGKGAAGHAAVAARCTAGTDRAADLAGRLSRVFDAVLGLLESYYARFFSAPFASAEAFENDGAGRFDRVVYLALRALEREIPPERRGPALAAGGSLDIADAISRLRRAEQAAWDRIYRNDVSDPAELSPLERSLADRVALQTSISMRHLQTLDVLIYLKDLCPNDLTPGDADADAGCDPDALFEAAENLYQLIVRVRGGDISGTPRPGRREVAFCVGTPVTVSERLPAYTRNRREATLALLADLERAWREDCDPKLTAPFRRHNSPC